MTVTSPAPWAPSALQRERIAYRRRQTVRSVLIAAASTAVLGVALVEVLIHAPGWPGVRSFFFDVPTAKEFFLDILGGLWLNIQLMFECAAGAVILGLAVATLRTLRSPVFFPVRALAATYTYGFRGLPLLILLYVFTLGVPGLRLAGTPSVMVLGGIAFVLSYGANLAEDFRAGIESVHPSQSAAARSLGLTHWQTMRFVVLPQAVRRVAPALLNEFVSLQKDVGLISVAGPIDAIRAAQIGAYENFNYTPYIVAAVLFVLLALPFIAVTDYVTLRAARRQSAGGPA